MSSTSCKAKILFSQQHIICIVTGGDSAAIVVVELDVFDSYPYIWHREAADSNHCRNDYRTSNQRNGLESREKGVGHGMQACLIFIVTIVYLEKVPLSHQKCIPSKQKCWRFNPYSSSQSQLDCNSELIDRIPNTTIENSQLALWHI